MAAADVQQYDAPRTVDQRRECIDGNALEWRIQRLAGNDTDPRLAENNNRGHKNEGAFDNG